MRYLKRLLLVPPLVIVCISILATRMTPGLLVIKSPRPGTSSSKNWMFRIQVPDVDAPLMASLSLQKHIPRQLDSGQLTYSLNTTTTVIVPISSKVSSMIGSIELEPSSNQLEVTATGSCRVTLKLMDSNGKLLGAESVAVDGRCGSIGYIRRYSKQLSLREINLVDLELLDGVGRNDFDVTLQFAKR